MEDLGKRMLKITILGANKSGKTALTVRFLTGKFIFDYATGHDVVYQHNFSVASTKVPLQIVDTSRNENLSEVICESDGMVIVYAIDNEKSFEKAKEILSDVMRRNGNEPCVALVANKSDLWPHKSVERADGKKLADRYHCKYFEMSALSCKDGVLDMFNDVIRLAVERFRWRSSSAPERNKPIQHEEIKRSYSVQMMKKEVKHGANTKTKILTKSYSLTSNLTTETKQSTNNKSKNRSVCDLGIGNLSESKQNGNNISRMFQRTLGDMGSHSVETKQTGNKSGSKSGNKLIHRTLGDMGHLAFSAIALPMSMNSRELKT